VEEVNVLGNAAINQANGKEDVSKTTLSNAQKVESSLLVSPDSGHENVPVILGSVDLLCYRQSTSVKRIGHGVIVIFAMPIRQHA
jgi:hypothetical protein